jgi:hypothetical protein
MEYMGGGGGGRSSDFICLAASKAGLAEWSKHVIVKQTNPPAQETSAVAANRRFQL